ncbi:MAG: hypothetical protein AABX88_02120 [Nanoarchaeota archaeon]
MMRRNRGAIFLIYVVVGAYLLNFAFKFYEFPAAISKIHIYVVGIAGILVILGGINYLRLQPMSHRY